MADAPLTAPAATPDRPAPDRQAIAAAWSEIAAQLEDREVRLSTVMRKNPLQFADDTTLIVSVDGPIFLEQLEKETPRLIKMLGQKLSFNKLKIQGKILAQEEGPRKAYTQYEKFEAMKERNPLLEKLQRELGLDLDG